MSAPAKRFALLMVAFSIIAVVFVACAAPTSPLPTGGNNGNGGVTGFHTPAPNNGQPTPAFPPFTIGAWPSNYSPGNNDTMTIYVLCRIQDQSMLKPAQPAAGLGVSIILSGPAGGSYSGKTDNDGLAAITFTLNDPNSGQPVTVTASTTWNGQAYSAQTFFTPNPGAKPTATPKSGPGGTPPPFPTVTPPGLP
ncbi:MAG TPA: hypothetical protein VKT52_03225 [Ktedonobacterales bacterium]|nr:hypothetical protein [Ktedonobacterales bacterium]